MNSFERQRTAEPSRAQSALRANAHYQLSLCSSSHCYTEDGGGGPLMSFWIWWSWPDIQKCPLSTSSVLIKGKWAGARRNARLHANNGTCVFAHQRLTWHTFTGWMINDRTKQIHEDSGENVCGLSHLHVLYVRLCVRMKGGRVGVCVKSGWMARAATVCRNSRMCTSSMRRWWALMPNKESQSTPIHSICQGDAF